MRRTWPVYLVLLLLLSALLGFAWLTRNPTAPLAVQAESWPVVGPLAARVRHAYLPPAPPPARAPSPPPIVVIVPGQEPSYAESAWPQLPMTVPRSPEDPETARLRRAMGIQPFEWLRAGAVLHAAPDAGTPALTTLAKPARATLLEERPDWLRVRLGVHDGWVERAAVSTEPPFGSDPLPLPGLPKTPGTREVQLQLARSLLPDVQPQPLTGYTLYTDRADKAQLAAYLEPVLAAVERAYEQRFGLRLQPPPEPPPALVIFARTQDYDELRRSEPRLAAVRTTGHSTSDGLIALSAGTRDRSSVAGLVVHEVAHLLHRRAFPSGELPPWLEEGLAEDLANSRVDAQGQLYPEQLGGQRLRRQQSITYSGGQASLRQLLAYTEGRPQRSVAELLATPQTPFLADPLPHYAHSAFWIRYLVEHEQLSPGFHRFLRAVAAGEEEELTAERLGHYLDRPWEELETGFAVWVKETLRRQMPEVVKLRSRDRIASTADALN